MPPELTASALIFLITLCYLVLCYASPYGRCRRCDGFGFHIGTTRKGRPLRGKDCRRCKGHGFRLRPGRHVVNALIRYWQHRDR
ncbi:hypothetical protein FH609_000420 [Streptomyces sp. 3MP-14]|uniref:Uncharacterized protein n=1 Tax=Streptomyces mimosae TaxID=2586635 RepID=A0A5N6ASN8_9ACTN|nr:MULTISPECIES: hypothetical protein [Streptomyces]KAB8171123.1 hypothetical protein FH607_002050 [Streptomyces mimosae]KAB8179525.1 hypothetical protein FH609_000420 [Streptomyces sp. 3MP-14]